MTIRKINPANEQEINLVAARMRETLVEVLGEEVGGKMYEMDWLIERAKWHLDPNNCIGEIFLSIEDDSHISGHTIVRVEKDDDEKPFGLFSTIYVEPESRGKSVATNLIETGEQWMKSHGMTSASTYTAENNERLKNLFGKRGYQVVLTKNDMIVLTKYFATGDGAN